MNLIEITIAIIIIMDPIGNTPIFVPFLKDFSLKRQQWIIFREHLISLATMLAFCYLGENILQTLQIEEHSLHITSGIILFIIALQMTFPKSSSQKNNTTTTDEPFITPLAIPLISGPSVLTTVMLFAAQTPNKYDMLLPITLACSISLTILWFSPHLYSLLGNKGLTVIERLMGMLLILISIQYFSNGIRIFTQTL